MKWDPIIGKTDCIEFSWSLVTAYRLSGRELVLIDTGAAPSPELLAGLDERGLRVRAILCTHPHHDHLANNPALYRRDGCPIYVTEDGLASAIEDRIRLYPASPGLTGPPPFTLIPGSASYVEVDGVRFRLIPTPGHMPGHTAFVTPDGVCVLGDALVSPQVLPQFKLPYMTNVEQALESMETIRQTRLPFYLCAHQGVTPLAGLQELVDANVRKELEIYDTLRRQAVRPIPVEELIDRFLAALDISPRTRAARWVRSSSMDRIRALVHAGELVLEDGVVRPN